ncbi:MAG: aspartate dehydrogenase [Lachnospiraceae bacterium]|nr:aspartate dehydrogenase [Lachnospiraceae bacterium]
MFGAKRSKHTYDRNKQKPAIRASICTGEKVAGFADIHGGLFEEVMLIRTPGDLERFRKEYDITCEIETIY